MSAARPRPSRDRPSSGIAMSPNLFTSRCAVLLVRIDRAILLRRARGQFLLALDYLGREAQIGFTSDAFEIVEQHPPAAGRGLPQPHLTPGGWVVDFLVAALVHLGNA